MMDEGKGRRPILVVEDELFTGLDISEALAARGYTVYGPISNLKSADRIADSYEFDAAILDYHLQDGTVRDLAEALIARMVPVIFYTGNPAEATQRYGGPDVLILEKPMGSGEIVKAMENMLRPAAD